MKYKNSTRLNTGLTIYINRLVYQYFSPSWFFLCLQSTRWSFELPPQKHEVSRWFFLTYLEKKLIFLRNIHLSGLHPDLDRSIIKAFHRPHMKNSCTKLKLNVTVPVPLIYEPNGMELTGSTGGIGIFWAEISSEARATLAFQSIIKGYFHWSWMDMYCFLGTFCPR